MSRIAAVYGVVPEHCYPQQTITAALGDVILGGDTGRRPVLERLHGNAGVRTRHLVLPLERYRDLGGFSRTNDAFIDCGLDLARAAVHGALERAHLTAADLDMIMTTTVTGVAAPSLDARLVPVLGLREDVKRVPLFGLGCVAGAAGIARVHDYLVGHPDEVAVLVSVEICSLTLQSDDTSTANLVASGLFGDGAAAVVMVGERRAQQLGLATGEGAMTPRVVATRSRFYPETERVMGWDVGTGGFKIVLAASVADVVEAHLGADVRTFLEAHELKIADVDTWVAHPGGPKVLEAMESALDLSPGALDVTWRSLAEVGNLSSASVLHVLARTLEEGRPLAGTPGMLLAMGPGFCAELVLLEW